MLDWILCTSMNLLYVEHMMLIGNLCVTHVMTNASSGSEGLSHTEIAAGQVFPYIEDFPSNLKLYFYLQRNSQHLPPK